MNRKEILFQIKEKLDNLRFVRNIELENNQLQIHCSTNLTNPEDFGEKVEKLLNNKGGMKDIFKPIPFCVLFRFSTCIITNRGKENPSLRFEVFVPLD